MRIEKGTYSVTGINKPIEFKGGDYELMRVRWYHRFWRWLIRYREDIEPTGILIATVKMNVYLTPEGKVRSTGHSPEMIRPPTRDWSK